MILFLDFDGVLHPLNKAEKFTRAHLLDTFLAEQCDVEIVLSTSWRQIFPLAVLRSKLTATIAERVIGATPIFPRAALEPAPAAVRERECRMWLDTNGRTDAAWIALDDEPTLFATRERVIVCDSRVGLTPESIEALQQHFRTS
ncbi:HAD domain-containing protein [Niveibacterium microcysteis]|uniref:HAD family hydrolase n=2 Tax=Niveibacterium TaxID=1769726 RepID=A0ABX7M7G5_9RHOO|nr:HAD domain-containing protein [Niveibacterium microcysteis]QSI76663.1 hypothetical protein JY500_19730 [Niveibacterium microcysteis]